MLEPYPVDRSVTPEHGSPQSAEAYKSPMQYDAQNPLVLESVHGGRTIKVFRADSTDPIAMQAKEIEISAMQELGDSEETARKEHVPYDPVSFFIVTLEDDSPDVVSGAMRIVPWSQEMGVKSLTDMASMDAIAEETPEEVLALVEADEGEFIDKTKIWDIATLGVLDHYRKHFKTGTLIQKDLLAASVELAKEAVENKALERIFSINEVHSHKDLINLGFPYKPIGEYGPVLYDTMHNTDEAGEAFGMTAQGGTFKVQTLLDRIIQAKQGRETVDRNEFGKHAVRFLGNLATRLYGEELSR